MRLSWLGPLAFTALVLASCQIQGAPVAIDDVRALDRGEAQIDVLENDYTSGAVVDIVLTSGPSCGEAHIEANTVVVRPTQECPGSLSFGYRLNSEFGSSQEAQVTVELGFSLFEHQLVTAAGFPIEVIIPPELGGGGGITPLEPPEFGALFPDDDRWFYVAEEGFAAPDDFVVALGDGSVHVIVSISVIELQGPSQVDFGPIEVGTSSRRSIRLTNASSSAVAVSVEPSTPPFEVVDPGSCAGELPAGAVCEMEVEFVPDEENVYRQDLFVHFVQGGLAIPLTGIGGQPELVFTKSPESPTTLEALSLPVTKVGLPGEAVNVSLRNISQVTTNVTDVVADPAEALIIVESTCSGPLESGASCEVVLSLSGAPPDNVGRPGLLPDLSTDIVNPGVLVDPSIDFLSPNVLEELAEVGSLAAVAPIPPSDIEVLGSLVARGSSDVLATLKLEALLAYPRLRVEGFDATGSKAEFPIAIFIEETARIDLTTTSRVPATISQVNLIALTEGVDPTVEISANTCIDAAQAERSLEVGQTCSIELTGFDCSFLHQRFRLEVISDAWQNRIAYVEAPRECIP